MVAFASSFPFPRGTKGQSEWKRGVAQGQRDSAHRILIDIIFSPFHQMMRNTPSGCSEVSSVGAVPDVRIRHLHFDRVARHPVFCLALEAQSKSLKTHDFGQENKRVSWHQFNSLLARHRSGKRGENFKILTAGTSIIGLLSFSFASSPLRSIQAASPSRNSFTLCGSKQFLDHLFSLRRRSRYVAGTLIQFVELEMCFQEHTQ